MTKRFKSRERSSAKSWLKESRVRRGVAEIVVKLRRMPNLVIDVKVVLTREFRFRMWTAAQLVRLAAWVLGGRAELEINGELQ
jgi:hypothetical protein